MEASTKEATIISFINMKGGVGKTTLCKEVSNYLSLCEVSSNKSAKVLLIDIDPQSNLTQALIERYKPTNADQVSIENIFDTKSMGYQMDKILLNLHDKLDLVPGELETVFLERAQNNNTSHKLMDFIKDNDLKNKYDYIFIDCPPTYSVYTEMAFFCSDYYIVPVIPDAYSALGVDLLERVVSDIIHNNRNTIFVNRKPRNLGVIFTRVDLKQKPQQQSFLEVLGNTDIVNKNDIYIFQSRFNESNKLSTSEFDKMITDRNDGRLIDMMDRICSELIARLEVLESGGVVAQEN